MKALILNCTLKPAPEASNTAALLEDVIEALEEHEVSCDVQRVVDLHIPFGIETDLGVDDEWPAVHAEVMASDILVIATPTWLGQPSSIAKLVLERLNALMGETHDDGTPVAFNKVAGVVVTGNEDGAHHVISEVNGGLVDIGFTIPGQAWTYWNMGPGPGPSYTETDHGHEWARSTGRTMAANLVAVATALRQHPMPPPG